MRNNVTVFVGSGSGVSRTPKFMDTDRARYIAYSPQGLAGSTPEQWKQDLHGGKPGVFVAIDRTRPAVEWFGGKKPSSVYLFDGGDVSPVPANRISGVTAGNHLVVPADTEAEHQLQNFLSLSDGFPADMRSCLFDAICQPDMRHRLARTERILAGLQKLEERAANADRAASIASWSRIKQLLPWAAGLVALIAIGYFGWQYFLASPPWREAPYPKAAAQTLATLIGRIQNHRSRSAVAIVASWKGVVPRVNEDGRIAASVPATLFWAASGPLRSESDAAQQAIVENRDLKELLLDATCRTNDRLAGTDGIILSLDDEHLPLWLGPCPEEQPSESTLEKGLSRLLEAWARQEAEPEPVPAVTATTIAKIDRSDTGVNTDFTLQIFGEGFTAKSKVRVGNNEREAKVLDAKHMTVQIMRADTARAGAVTISVTSPDGKSSASAVLTVK